MVSETLCLQLPNAIALHVTPKQFEALSAANSDLILERTATGELIVNPPTGGETGYRNSKIVYFLVKWIEEQGGFGIAFDSSTGFRLPNGANRSPDAAWVQPKRWQSLTPQQRKGFLPICPDFVIELRSQSDNLAQLRAKMQEYIENGAKLGWLIDPQNQRVEIYRPDEEIEILDNPISLSGETVLPGFVLNLTSIWLIQ
jgi:Uma2 family endonuclease